ncbi:arylsulfatase H-like isoform X1 [Homarus americanus]|uniref:arylsulfatase H-like isoform X1 n=2 Tax=Homarus americanus TaxID=6706 RepID=UPI001C48D4A6|nr:arylsulfatase H-like isoform X1 [Homarus americanus]
MSYSSRTLYHSGDLNNTSCKMERVWVWVWAVGVMVTASAGHTKPPNILVMLADDLGIGDLGCYGNTTINTPNIDRLASEGVKLTHHLAAAPLCTPSRAAMLTGRYPAHYGLVADDLLLPVILHVASHAALPVEEVTLADALQAANYTTSLVGKWHLGMHCDWLGRSCPGPLSHGFQSFFGIPVTLFQEFRGPHPFWKFPLGETKFQGLLVTWVVTALSLLVAAKKQTVRLSVVVFLALLTNLLLALVWFVFAHNSKNPECIWQVSPWMHRHINSMLMRNDKMVETPIQLDGLSQRLVEESRQFLAAHANDDRPFFLFHSFAHVHTPMFSAPHMRGVSKHGRYGDNVEELDESVGAVLEALKQYGLEDNTLVYFTSDQGGHLEAVDSDGQRIGGHNGRYKGGKVQGGSEGAIRVPGIYKWPGHLPKGVTVDTPTSLMDLLPTVLSLAGLPHLPKLLPRAVDKELDGEDISELLVTGKTQKGPRVFLHHCQQAIHALRLATEEHVYKMYLKKHNWFPGSTQCGWGYDVACRCYGEFIYNLTQPELWDLRVDPYEDGKPISSHTQEYKDVVGKLLAYLKKWQEKVHYAPAQLSSIPQVMWRPWLQPH